MRGERPSQRPNRAADLDEPVQVFSSHLGGIGHDPRVEILQLPLDVIQGAEVAGDDPVENRCNERGCVKRADLTSPLDALEKLLEHVGPLTIGGDDPVHTENTLDWNELRRIPAAVYDVQRHVHALAFIGHGGASRVLA